MKNFLVFLLLVFVVFGSNAQNFNRPVPTGLLPYEFQSYATGIDFYTCINMNNIGPVNLGTALEYKRGVILDPDGYIVWFQDINPSNVNAISGFGYNPDNQVFQMVVAYSGQNKWYYLLDQGLNIVDSIQPINGAGPDSHDFLITSSGNRFVTTYRNETMDLSAFTIDGQQGDANTNVLCNGYQEFDSNNNLIAEWNSCDHIHPSEFYGHNYNVNNFDYFHINSVDEDDDGHILISARHTSTIVKVDRNTGDVIWRLGGLNSDFTFVNDLENGISSQHDARSLGNGIISIHDNGNGHSPARSRGVIYQLDTVNWTATVLEDVNPAVNYYGQAMGSHRTINDFHVVNYGANYRPEPNIGIFDSNNDLIAEYYFTDSAVTYRALPFNLDFSFPQPSITCIDSMGVLYLHAPDGHPSYEWSTGETSQDIIAIPGETYQVYVPYGIGKIASYPFMPDANCANTISIDELEKPVKTLLKTVDLLGREIDLYTSGQVIIHIYSDGTIQRVVHLE